MAPARRQPVRTATGLWRHCQGPVETPRHLGQVTYDEQRFTRYPRHHHHAPESELQRHLQEASAVLAAATPASGESIDDLVSDDFEHLR
jgi:hypothetical protein